MKKKLFTIAALSVMSYSAFAGGLLTNTNQNVAFLRHIARDATTDIDAAYSNPAGLAFLEDGFHISLNVQSAYQTRTIVSTFEPFKGNGGEATKTFEGDAKAPVIPSLQAAYKKDQWVFSANFAIIGGGGKATFDKGLSSFESQVAMIPLMLSKAGIPTNQYSVDCYMQGRQYVYGGQLGATYKATDYLSAYAGLRMVYSDNSYEGYIRNIQVNPTIPIPGLGYDGKKMASAADFKRLAELTRNPALSQVAAGMADKEVKCTQSGLGIAPVLGVHFKMGKFNAAVKYEYNTPLSVENSTEVDDTGLFPDGAKTTQDIPALLTTGVQYDILPALRASVGFHYYFDKNARMENNRQDYLDHNTYEVLFGMEWDITKRILVSAGIQRTEYGLTDEYEKDMSFSLCSFSYGFGGAFMITKDLKLNAACFFTDYEDYTKKSTNYNGTGLPGQDVFKRTNLVLGLGVNYRF